MLMLDFPNLIARVRTGDQSAAWELVREYEPEIRRIVRVQLQSSALRQSQESSDVCQSVFLRFFLGLRAGDFVLDTPAQLVGLLATIARHRLRDLSRRQRAIKRGGNTRAHAGHEAAETVPDPTPGPEQLVTCREIQAAVRSRLTDEQRFLLEQRDAGRNWTEIAADLGEPAETVRKRLTRALDRAVRELELE
jgi:RNA polymerase sigma factor (sigma-70 family)